MYGAVEQIGQTLVCPDCGTPAVVPPPPIVPTKPVAPPVVGETYALCEEVPSASAARHAAEEDLIRVMCHRCGTLMYATADQVGGSLVCPDCTSSVVVPPRPPPRHKIDVMANAGEGYGLAIADPTSPGETPAPLEPSARVQGVRARARRQFDPYLRHSILPRRPFLNGTFTFPLSHNVLPRYLLLIAWTTVSAMYSVGGGLLSGTEPNMTWFGGAALIATGAVLMVAWFGVASALALAIVRDTASGCDKVQNWPGLGFIDWLTDPLYILFSLGASFLPGVALNYLLEWCDLSSPLILPASVFVLYPFVLMSMLETGSPLGAVSWPVCQTLWWAGRGWVAFYLTAAWLLAIAGVVAAAAFSAGAIFGGFAALAIESAVWLIYFRLLGRLAWYCTDRMRKRAESDAVE
jgi:DNA-directed RNA polymerase subunit RPC12/RpoP